MVEECSIFQKYSRNNTKSSIQTKEIPSLPFEIVATDLFYFDGQEYIVMVDSCSGYFDFRRLENSDSQTVIVKLKEWFAQHGIPSKVESDNGPKFSSLAFKKFAKEWQFDHVTSSPRFPRSNGLAERYVQVSKSILKRCKNDNSDVQLALLHTRNTPRDDSLLSANQRLMNRTLRTNLPVTKKALEPRVITGVPENLAELRHAQKVYADQHSKEPKPFSPGEKVLWRNPDDKCWKAGTIERNVDCYDRSYVVRTADNKLLR